MTITELQRKHEALFAQAAELRRASRALLYSLQGPVEMGALLPPQGEKTQPTELAELAAHLRAGVASFQYAAAEYERFAEIAERAISAEPGGWDAVADN